MKVQIVYLNPEDDIHSAQDMLSWVKAPHALLIWPDRGKVLSHPLDIVRLLRYSRQRKIELGFLTFDSDVRAWAKEFGIPVFDSLDSFSIQNWDVNYTNEAPQPKQPLFDPTDATHEESETGAPGWSDGMRLRHRMVVAAGVALILAILGLWLIPSATVNILPETNDQTMELDLILLDGEFVTSKGVQIPHQIITIEVSGQRTEETTGSVSIPAAKAAGKVIFTNLSSTPVAIPADTVVRTSSDGGVRFKTVAPATLSEEIGAEVEISVEALSFGQIGNVSVDQISFIEGPLGLVLRVHNTEAFQGGVDEIRRVVTQEDLARTEGTLVAELINQAEKELTKNVSPGQIVVDGSLEAMPDHEGRYSHPEGEITESVSVDLTLELVATTLSIQALQEAAIELAVDELPAGYRIVNDSMKINEVVFLQNEDAKTQRMSYSVHFSTYQTCDKELIVSSIRGQSSVEAVGILFELVDLAFVPTIQVEPAWFPTLPFFDQRIELLCHGE